MGRPANRRGVGVPYIIGPIIIFLHLLTLKLTPMLLPTHSQIMSMLCRSITDADNRIRSSAYIKHPTNIVFIWQPRPLDFNDTSNTSTYTLNKTGERMPPCLTPLKTKRGSES